MSQKQEKRARRAWRNRMQAVAGSDWDKFMKLTEKKIIHYHRVIIGLSVLSIILSVAAVWGWLR